MGLRRTGSGGGDGGMLKYKEVRREEREKGRSVCLGVGGARRGWRGEGKCFSPRAIIA